MKKSDTSADSADETADATAPASPTPATVRVKTRDDLVSDAEALGITVGSKWNKATILAKIQEASLPTAAPSPAPAEAVGKLCAGEAPKSAPTKSMLEYLILEAELAEHRAKAAQAEAVARLVGSITEMVSGLPNAEEFVAQMLGMIDGLQESPNDGPQPTRRSTRADHTDQIRRRMRAGLPN